MRPRPERDDVTAIESPCIKVCIIEPGTGLCQGCGRTLHEIAAWGSMSGAERRRIMGELADRRARLSTR